MQPWQDEVARLLDQAAQALREKAERRAVRSFGTAIGYLELASEHGDRLAAELLALAAKHAKEDPTERFTFQPGELEALSQQDAPEEERPRATKKKKK